MGMKSKGYKKGGMKSKGMAKGGMKSKGYAKGGMKTKGYSRGGRQGYNDRLDESLGMRDGKESTKSQSMKSRRDESKGMEKSMGKRAYSGNRSSAQGSSNPLAGFKNMGTMKKGWD